MKYTVNENFEIDVSYIWKYERDRFIHYECNEENYKTLKELYFFLQSFYFLHEHKPFLKFSDIKEGKATWEYYNTKLRDYRDYINDVMPVKNSTVPYHFMSGDDFYDMHQPCVLKRKELNEADFEELFTLKLRQYHEGLSFIEGFLKYQLKNNFNNNLKTFKTFLKYLLLQHENLIDKKIIQVSNNWLAEADAKFAGKSLRRSTIKSEKGTVQLKESNASLHDIPNLEIVPPEANKNIETLNEDIMPDGYKVIKGKFTLDEIDKYFSFLYIEKSNHGEPFLPEEDVKEIFKYGIAIPEHPLKTKYKLNCSFSFPKKIIEYSIYNFFTNYSILRNDKTDILLFFANYIEDFEKALISKQNLLSWNKNISKQPVRMHFNLNFYLPLRFQKPKTSP